MKFFETNIKGFRIRTTEPQDCKLILKFINAIAKYEHLEQDVQNDEETLCEWLFQKKTAEVRIGELNGDPAGFVLFFYNFSSFLGKGGLYLEDIFVFPEFRRLGLGKAMFRHLAQEAVYRGCGRMEWVCLDWNQPSIDFYVSHGARAMDEWTLFRMTEKELRALL